MANIYWYCLLAIIGLVLTVFSIYKKREYRLSTFLVFYLLATSVAWMGEFIVLGLFNSYAYKTGIYKDPWAENLLGHLILNSTLYPGTAVLVAAFSLGSGWILLITVIYLLIDYWFLKLGLYEHHWWRYYMTGLAIINYQIIVRAWFNKMKTVRQGVFRIITFYFAGFVLMHYSIPIILLLDKAYYKVNLVPDRYLSSTLFIYSYQLIETFLLVFFVCILKKWYWKIMPFIIAAVGQTILVKMNILIFHNGWNLYYTLLLYSLSITIFILMERYTLIPEAGDGGHIS